MHLHHIVQLYSLSYVNYLSHNDTYNILNNFDRFDSITKETRFGGASERKFEIRTNRECRFICRTGLSLQKDLTISNFSRELQNCF